MKRRVVVTGIGAVSPNGIGRENFWQATRRGQSGVKRIARFESLPFRGPDRGRRLPISTKARTSSREGPPPRFALRATFAVAAAREAVADARASSPDA